MVSPAAKRRALGGLLEKGISRQLGCKVVGLSRNASRASKVERRPDCATRFCGSRSRIRATSFVGYMRCCRA